MVKVNLGILSNMMGKPCLVDVNMRNIKSSIIIKEFEILVFDEKILIGEKNFEMAIFELENNITDIEDLNLFESNGEDIRIKLNNIDYVDITNLHY